MIPVGPATSGGLRPRADTRTVPSRTTLVTAVRPLLQQLTGRFARVITRRRRRRRWPDFILSSLNVQRREGNWTLRNWDRVGYADGAASRSPPRADRGFRGHPRAHRQVSWLVPLAVRRPSHRRSRESTRMRDRRVRVDKRTHPRRSETSENSPLGPRSRARGTYNVCSACPVWA